MDKECCDLPSPEKAVTSEPTYYNPAEGVWQQVMYSYVAQGNEIGVAIAAADKAFARASEVLSPVKQTNPFF